MKHYFFNPKPELFVFAAILLLFFFARNASAWGDEGHRIVARIAAANLDQPARQEIAALLQNIPCPNASTLADRLACASVWADSVRKSKYPETYNWHFVDVSLKFDDYKHNRDCEEDSAKGDCGLPALDGLQAFLKGEPADQKYKKYSRTNALQFIIHIVGDLHQPLHTVREEVGGNFLFVKYRDSAAGKKIDCYDPDSGKNFQDLRKKLHGIWDTCILTEPLRITNLPKYVKELNKNITSQQKDEYEDGSSLDWFLETHQVAINNSYNSIPKGKKSGKNRYSTIPADYFGNNKDVVERQLQRAGIRLAKILNDIFAG